MLGAVFTAAGYIAEHLSPAAEVIQILPEIIVVIVGVEHIHFIGLEGAVAILVLPGIDHTVYGRFN